MLNIDIFEDFISVGAKKEIFKYANAIMPEMGYEVFKSGYDVEDFVKHIVSSSNMGFDDILDNFTFDSEYSMFCMYYKKPKGYVTDEQISKCTDLVLILNQMIRNEYLNAVSNVNTNVEIYDTRKN
jgi:hypothetical protein